MLTQREWTKSHFMLNCPPLGIRLLILIVAAYTATANSAIKIASCELKLKTLRYLHLKVLVSRKSRIYVSSVGSKSHFIQGPVSQLIGEIRLSLHLGLQQILCLAALPLLVKYYTICNNLIYGYLVDSLSPMFKQDRTSQAPKDSRHFVLAG